MKTKTEAAVKPVVATSRVVKEKPAGYRLTETPRGKALFTYFLAVLTKAGGFTTARKSMEREGLVKYFDSDSVITHHKKCGNIEATATGFRLTVNGWNHFSGRLNGKTAGQDVVKAEMTTMVAALKSGKLAKKTQHFAANTKFMALKA